MKKDKIHQYKFTYNLTFMNIISILITIFIIFITYLLYKIGIINNIFDELINILYSQDNKPFHDLTFFISLIVMFLWFVLHEVIHGISYIINGASKENIKYGLVLEKGIFFTKCSEFINRKNILFSVIAPFILIGVTTYLIGIIIKNPILIILSILNISGCAGDLMMFIFFLKRDKDCLFKEVGDSTTFILKTSEDLTNKKFKGVKLLEEIDELASDKEFTKRINISKISKYFLIIILIVLLLSFISYVF